jgi:selenoprotein W-related protein
MLGTEDAQAPLRPALLVNARTSVPVQLREKVNVSARNDSASHVVRPRAQRSDGAPKGSPSELAPRCWPPQAGRSIEITYCRLCGWGLRAGWMAQELLTTFAEELGSVTLTPDRTGGVFEVRIDDELIWSRKERGRFPEIKEIKQLIRDRVAPGRSLGHTDTPLTT